MTSQPDRCFFQRLIERMRSILRCWPVCEMCVCAYIIKPLHRLYFEHRLIIRNNLRLHIIIIFLYQAIITSLRLPFEISIMFIVCMYVYSLFCSLSDVWLWSLWSFMHIYLYDIEIRMLYTVLSCCSCVRFCERHRKGERDRETETIYFKGKMAYGILLAIILLYVYAISFYHSSATSLFAWADLFDLLNKKSKKKCGACFSIVVSIATKQKDSIEMNW